jgi:hypothetical protein
MNHIFAVVAALRPPLDETKHDGSWGALGDSSVEFDIEFQIFRFDRAVGF